MKKTNNSKFLRELLEKVIFDEKELVKLKSNITQLISGTISSRKFKEQIIQFRTTLLEELVKFFSYYLDHYSKKNSLSHDQNLVKNQQLEERDFLLEMIGTRLKKLYEKLSSK